MLKRIKKKLIDSLFFIIATLFFNYFRSRSADFVKKDLLPQFIGKNLFQSTYPLLNQRCNILGRIRDIILITKIIHISGDNHKANSATITTNHPCMLTVKTL